jgi:hypothetical protein
MDWLVSVRILPYKIENGLLKRDLKISVAGCQLEEALYRPGPAQGHDDLVGVDVLYGLFAGQEQKTWRKPLDLDSTGYVNPDPDHQGWQKWIAKNE